MLPTKFDQWTTRIFHAVTLLLVSGTSAYASCDRFTARTHTNIASNSAGHTEAIFAPLASPAITTAGDVIKLTGLVNVGPAVTVRLDITAGGVTHRSANVTLPGSVELTLPTDINGGLSYDVNVISTAAAVTGADKFSVDLSCSAPAVTNNPKQPTSSQTQSVISRAQSTIVQSNINYRVETAFSSPGKSPDNQASRQSSGQNAEQLFAPTTAVSGNRFEDAIPLFDFNTATMAATPENTNSPAAIRSDSSNKPVIWGHGSWLRAENDRNLLNDDQRFDGEVWAYNIGIDRKFGQNLLAGIAAGYTETRLDTDFNNGSYAEDSWTVAPYMIWNLDGTRLLLEGGYSIGDVEQNRANGSVTAKTDSNAWFGALQASRVFTPFSDPELHVKAVLDISGGQKTLDAFTESDGSFVAESRSDSLTIMPGIEADWSWHLTQSNIVLSPFVTLTGLYDFADTINDDRSAVIVGAGVEILQHQSGLNGSIRTRQQLLRDDYSEFSIDALVSYDLDLSQIAGMGMTMRPRASFGIGETGSSQFTTGTSFLVLPNQALQIGVNYVTTLDGAHGGTGNLDLRLAF